MFLSKAKYNRLMNEVSYANSTSCEAHDRLDQLDRNGVATRINELSTELFADRKTVKENDLFGMYSMWDKLNGFHRKTYEPTLAGKVDAIIEHLGIEFKMTEETKTPSKVVASKKKAPAKKKGRK